MKNKGVGLIAAAGQHPGWVIKAQVVASDLEQSHSFRHLNRRFSSVSAEKGDAEKL